MGKQSGTSGNILRMVQHRGLPAVRPDLLQPQVCNSLFAVNDAWLHLRGSLTLRPLNDHQTDFPQFRAVACEVSRIICVRAAGCAMVRSRVCLGPLEMVVERTPIVAPHDRPNFLRLGTDPALGYKPHIPAAPLVLREDNKRPRPSRGLPPMQCGHGSTAKSYVVPPVNLPTQPLKSRGTWVNSPTHGESPNGFDPQNGFDPPPPPPAGRAARRAQEPEVRGGLREGQGRQEPGAPRAPAAGGGGGVRVRARWLPMGGVWEAERFSGQPSSWACAAEGLVLHQLV